MRRFLPAAALVLLGIALYGRGFGVGLVGDDYTLLDAALRESLAELLTGRHGILGYYRPLSRELYFWTLGHLAGAAPVAYHAVNALVFALMLAGFHGWARRWQGERVATLATLAFVLFPACGALLTWISCAQDLIALLFGVAALLAYARGRHALAGVAVLAAALSKETAIVIGPAIAVFDACAHPDSALGARLRRLAPVGIALAAALAIAVAARLTWPSGTSMAIWSPRQLRGALALPWDFARTFWPPDSLAGVAKAWRETPLALILVAALAALAVPAGRTRLEATAGRALTFALALTVLGMLPVGVILERWRGYFFSFAALGSSLMLGLALARVHPWGARIVAASLAIVCFGANGIYRPVPAATGPARHPHVNYAFFKENAELTDRLLASLTAWCPSLKRTPRVFTLGVPRDALFESVLGPALRVTCRDTVSSRVRALDDMRPEDASGEFGVMRFDPQSVALTFELADPVSKVAIGEGLLLSGRYPQAAACLASAVRAGLGDPLVAYRATLALAAAGRVAEAESLWAHSRASGRALTAGALATRLLQEGGGTPPASDRLRALAAAALADPASASAHSALGRELMLLHQPRAAALELVTAAGRGAAGEPMMWLAEAYETLGALPEARGAYARALAGPLDPEARARAQSRAAALDRATIHPGIP